MQIDPNLTVGDLIKKVEAEITERQTFLAFLKANVVITDKKNENNLSPVSPKNNSAKGEITLADRVENILKEIGKPLLQTEIRDELKKQGINTKLPNYTGRIYTSLSRRKDIFVRVSDGAWALKEWDIQALNQQIANNKNANLFTGTKWDKEGLISV